MSNFEKAALAGVPSVHLNGTSRADLEAQFRSAHEVVNAALKQIAVNYPHLRDYYVQGSENGFPKADEKHKGRLAALRDILAGIESDYRAFIDSNE